MDKMFMVSPKSIDAPMEKMSDLVLKQSLTNYPPDCVIFKNLMLYSKLYMYTTFIGGISTVLSIFEDVDYIKFRRSIMQVLWSEYYKIGADASIFSDFRRYLHIRTIFDDTMDSKDIESPRNFKSYHGTINVYETTNDTYGKGHHIIMDYIRSTDTFHNRKVRDGNQEVDTCRIY